MNQESSTPLPAAGASYLTPSASYGFNATPNSVSGPPAASHKSLSHFIADLQHNLRDAFEPALIALTSSLPQQASSTLYNHDPSLLHPLAVSTGSHPAAPGPSTLQLPWELVTSALSSFEYQVLNAGMNIPHDITNAQQFISPASAVSDKDRIRLLALMRETGALTLADIATEEGTHRTKRLLDRRKLYRIGYPGSFAGKKNVKEVLESMAKDAGWETFQGADEGGGDGNDMQTDDASTTSTSHTITMAGKGVVLDVDYELSQNAKKEDAQAQSSGSSFGTITAVRFSYGLEGSTDPGIDKLLSKQAKASDWPAMRDSLLALSRSDDVIGLQESMSRDEENEGTMNADDTSGAGDLDPFSAMKGLTMKVEEVFKSELEVASDASHLFTTGHGVAIAYHDSPYFQLIYHVQPYVLQTEEWDNVVQSGFQNEELANLTALDTGVFSVRFRVAKSSGPLPFNLALPQALTGIEAVNKASFPLLPSAPAGLDDKIMTGLYFVADLEEPIVISAAAGRRLQDILLGTSTSTMLFAMQLQQQLAVEGGISTIENMLLPAIEAYKYYNLDMSDMGMCPPIRAKLQPLSQIPAFKLDHFAFETVDQLLAVIEVLRVQACFNDMLQALFEGATPGTEQGDIEAGITLDDLLSDDPLSDITLTVQTDTDSSWPPSLNLSFLLPQVPSWLPITAVFNVKPSFMDPTGVECTCNFIVNNATSEHESSERIVKHLSKLIFGNEEDRKRTKTLQDVLAIIRDPKTVIRWINSRLGRYTTKISVDGALASASSPAKWRSLLEEPSLLVS